MAKVAKAAKLAKAAKAAKEKNQKCSAARQEMDNYLNKKEKGAKSAKTEAKSAPPSSNDLDGDLDGYFSKRPRKLQKEPRVRLFASCTLNRTGGYLKQTKNQCSK